MASTVVVAHRSSSIVVVAHHFLIHFLLPLKFIFYFIFLICMNELFVFVYIEIVLILDCLNALLWHSRQTKLVYFWEISYFRHFYC